ncbi:uncharacterized protein LOC115067336 [Nannospalax galili]|uniref:uncharacterized protein LOC115067336 n=1 Tax=Nannospalax galili TaxID=1026970 RepID=UPI00111C73CB|nr:uncharacterized protein LOC115067336 [Nannospalax galili]
MLMRCVEGGVKNDQSRCREPKRALRSTRPPPPPPRPLALGFGGAPAQPRGGAEGRGLCKYVYGEGAWAREGGSSFPYTLLERLLQSLQQTEDWRLPGRFLRPVRRVPRAYSNPRLQISVTHLARRNKIFEKPGCAGVESENAGSRIDKTIWEKCMRVARPEEPESPRNNLAADLGIVGRLEPWSWVLGFSSGCFGCRFWEKDYMHTTTTAESTQPRFVGRGLWGTQHCKEDRVGSDPLLLKHQIEGRTSRSPDAGTIDSPPEVEGAPAGKSRYRRQRITTTWSPVIQCAQSCVFLTPLTVKIPRSHLIQSRSQPISE